MRERVYINDNWLFTHEFYDELINKDTDESSLLSVRLPHTNKELGYNCINEKDYQELMGYRKHLYADNAWSGQRVTITFEGAAHKALVYVNGKLVMEHGNGYTGFSADITDFLKFGEDNIIAVSLDSRESLNVPPFGKVIDYMTYGGIYRDVYIEIHDQVYLKDVYVMPTDITVNQSSLYVKAELSQLPQDTRIVVSGKLTDKCRPGAENAVDKFEYSFTPSMLISDDKHVIGNVNLWSVDEPNLYRIKVSLYVGDKLRDERRVRTGFRSAKFKKDGFYLNGRRFKIRGMDRHQCYPYVGYAMPASMQALDADILKNELSLNAVRTSHYPQSHYFLDRCDEIGILVFTEFPGWQHIGDDAWKQQAVQNVREMVTEFRNHTSIILWGVRINESQDDDVFYEKTNQVAHELDPFRPTGGVRNFAKSHLLEDVYTYNDFVHSGNNQGAEPKSKITPDMDKPYLISEYNGHMFPTKSFDKEDIRKEHALRHANVIDQVAGYPDIAGSFGWCMFDYNTHKDFGSGDRICYHGIMDMFRNPKMAAAVYESQKDPKDGVVLEISSSMDIGEHPACYLGAVYAFTNADSVKMYKNGEFINEFFAKDSEYKNLPHGPIKMEDFVGRQLIEKEGFSEKKAEMVKELLIGFSKYGLDGLPVSIKVTAAKLMTLYKMTYDDGVELYGKYIANWGGCVTTYRYDAIVGGKVVKSVTKSPAENLRLDIKANTNELKDSNSYDVAAIRIAAVDQNGNVANYYSEPVKIKVSGPVEIIGPDVISLKGGMFGTYIKTVGKSGTATVTFSSAQLPDVKLAFDVEA